MLGKVKVKLQYEAGAKSKSMVCVVKGQKKSLLGRLDSEALSPSAMRGRQVQETQSDS